VIRWTAEASDDFVAIHEHIALDSLAAADRQCKLIMDSIRQLRPFSRLGKPTRVFTIRELAVPRTPYIVFYRPEQTAIVLIRIMHGSMLIPPSLRK
jgi:plasmid stabilization system protein ParE